MLEESYTTVERGTNAKFGTTSSNFSMSRARDGTRGSARTVVHGHFQVDGDAKTAVGQAFYADNLGNIFAIHGVMHGAKREGDEKAHPFVVVGAPCMEINAFFRGVYADGQILEMLVAGVRGADAQGLGQFSPTAATLLRVLGWARLRHALGFLAGYSIIEARH